MKSDADQIREYVWIRYIEPARHRGDATVSIKSGDVVKGLNLKNKTPNVCTALRSKIFQDVYGVRLLEEQGPPSGMSTTVVFTYKVTHQPGMKTAKTRPRRRSTGCVGSQKRFSRTRRLGTLDQKDRRNFMAKRRAIA